jgi:hypothetical protein
MLHASLPFICAFQSDGVNGLAIPLSLLSVGESWASTGSVPLTREGNSHIVLTELFLIPACFSFVLRVMNYDSLADLRTCFLVHVFVD